MDKPEEFEILTKMAELMNIPKITSISFKKQWPQ